MCLNYLVWLGRPTDAQLERVSRYIGSNYQLVGVALGLNIRDIDQMESTNSYNGQSRIFRMLVAWRDRDGEPTVEKLISVLTEFISRMDVNEIRQMFQRTNANATWFWNSGKNILIVFMNILTQNLSLIINKKSSLL